MAQLVKSTINIEGHTIRNFLSVRVDQYLNTHHHFEVVVPYEEFESEGAIFFQQAHQKLCGKKITMKFEPLFTKFSKGSGSQFQFMGIVTEVTLQSSSELVNSFVIRGYSPTYLLEDGVQRRGFIKETLKGIFGKVLGQYSGNLLSRKLSPRHSIKLDYKAQYDESNFEFLSRLAAEYGEWFFYDGQKLILGPPSGNTVEFWVDGIQNFSMAIGLKPAKFKMYHHNYYNNIEYKGDSSVGIQMSPFVRFAHGESEKLFRQESYLGTFRDIRDNSELNDTIKSIKSVNASDMVTFRGTGENPTINLGDLINVKGQKLDRDYQRTTEDFGKYCLTEITHTVDSEGNYENFFKAVPDSSSHPPHNFNVRAPIAQPELAKVFKNNDPDSLGRIKVKFYWGNQQECESQWMRITQAYTGGPKGMLWIPELEDQVIVGYEFNNPDLPFVMGSVYPKDRAGAKYTNNDNLKKIIRTKGGNKIIFKDDQGKEEIYITHSKYGRSAKTGTSLLISFESNGAIKLHTQGDIEIEAGQNIKMKAGKDFSIESTMGDITIAAKMKNVKISATQNVEAKATASMKLTANVNAELSASVKTEVSGKAMAKLSGAKVDVEGMGMVGIQAPLVKIN